MLAIDFISITPCGGCCDECEYLQRNECSGCRANGGKCVKMWSNECEIFACCTKHGVHFCGVCEKFPCEWLSSKLSEWNPNGIDELKHLAEVYNKQNL